MYLIKAKNCKDGIVIPKAQSKLDAIRKAENCLGIKLEKPIKVKFAKNKKDCFFNFEVGTYQ